MNKPFLFILLLVPAWGLTQRDTSFTAKNPMTYSVSILFPIRNIGVQVGMARLVKQKEIHKHPSSAHPKIIKKERWISLDLGFYTQRSLHNSLFLTGSYAFRRVNTNGFYRQFRPFLGISQTFLNEESYSVNANNDVILHKAAGNFYFTGGVGLGFGKVFSQPKAKFIRDVHAGFWVQSYFPNFRFLALRPAFQIGIEAVFPKLSKTFRKKIIVKP